MHQLLRVGIERAALGLIDRGAGLADQLIERRIVPMGLVPGRIGRIEQREDRVGRRLHVVESDVERALFPDLIQVGAVRHGLHIDIESRRLRHLTHGDRQLGPDRRLVGRDQGRGETVRIPGLGKQLLRLGDVGLGQRLIGVEAIGAAERRIIAGRAIALDDEIDQGRPVDAERQRLADPHIVERLLIAAEDDVAELAGRDAQRPDAVGALEPGIFGRLHADHQIRIARDQRRALGRAVRIDQHFDPVEIGPILVVIGLVAHDGDEPFGLERDQLERAGADRLLIQAGQPGLGDRGRNDLGIGIGERDRQVGEGCRQLEKDRRLVLRRHLGDRADILQRRRGGLRIEDRLEARNHVVGGTRAAVMEHEPVAQLERPFGQIGRIGPGMGQIRFRRHIGAQAGQAAVEQLGHQILAIDPGLQRIELGDRLIDADAQGAAALRHGGQRTAHRQAEGAEGGRPRDETPPIDLCELEHASGPYRFVSVVRTASLRNRG